MCSSLLYSFSSNKCVTLVIEPNCSLHFEAYNKNIQFWLFSMQQLEHIHIHHFAQPANNLNCLSAALILALFEFEIILS